MNKRQRKKRVDKLLLELKTVINQLEKDLITPNKCSAEQSIILYKPRGGGWIKAGIRNSNLQKLIDMKR